MKSMKKTLLLLCSLFALVLSIGLAACGSKKPKLSFETFGGTEIAPIEAEAGADISALLPEEPARDGYFFEGWYLEEDCSGTVQELPAVMPEKSVTYYAKWIEGVGAKLTLSAGSGGTLERTSYNIAVGRGLAEFLADKSPTPRAGLTFAGWYRAGATAPISERDTMPASGISLTAKYTTQYTVEVYEQQADKSFTKKGENITGTAIYGEPFDCSTLVQAEEHFFTDGGDDGQLSTDSLGIGETFKVYLMRDRYYVTYRANAQGATVQGNTPMDYFVYGGKPTLAECGFKLGGAYRFAGWSYKEEAKSPDDLIQPDTELEIENYDNITVYAIWEKGYTDVFGGSDAIFPDLFEEGVVRLVREGVEVKEGTCDTDGYFTFEEEEKTYLSGQLLPAQEKFFYYRDSLEKTYTDMDGTEATLKMQPNGVVIYTDAQSQQHTGKYSINSDGYFIFDADDGEDFLYNLYTLADGNEQIVFRRQSAEEMGYYYDASANVVLYLDGLGGLRYFYHKDNAEYTDFNGDPVYTAIGYYERMRGQELFLAQTRDIVSILKQFTFTTKLQSESRPEGFPDLPQDAVIKGVAGLDDGLRGSYYEKWGKTPAKLYLDGYGKGTYGEKEGTYELITWLYSYEEEDSEVVDDYLLVRFSPADGSKYSYFRIDADYSDYELDREITGADAEKYKGLLGRFDFTNEIIANNIVFEGFIYIFENGDAEVWTVYDISRLGRTVYVLYEELISKVTVGEDGNYTFEHTVDTETALPLNNEFNFSLDGEKKTATYIPPKEHVTATVTEGLTLDYTTHTATYNGEKVFYQYTVGYIDYYVFKYGGADHYFWTESGKHDTFYPIDEDTIYIIRTTEELLMYSYVGVLFFVEGTESASDKVENRKVYLAYELSGGMYRFVAEGTVNSTDGGDYTFKLSQHLSDMDNSEFEDYNAFTFRTYSDGTFVKYSEELSFSNFTSDGYGVYTYVDDGGRTYVGSVTETIGSGAGMIIRFAGWEGSVPEGTATPPKEFVFAVDTTSTKVVCPTEDIGYWYELDENQLISTNNYFTFDGMGNAYYYEYDWMLGNLSKQQGTYRRSPNFVSPLESQYPYYEYIVTLGGKETYYLLGVYYVSDNTAGSTIQLPLYQARIPHRIGNFRVRGGGEISSVGYPGEPAVYTDSFGDEYEGNMYIGSVRSGYDNHGFISDPAGNQVRFWALGQNDMSVSIEFFFEIVNGELVPFSYAYGDYALSQDDTIVGSTVLRLDGRGSATLRVGKEEALEGTYTAIAGTTDEYQFTAEGRSFRFRLSTATENDKTVYVYEIFDSDSAFLLFSAGDWSVLILDGYGDAHYINKYGDLIIGEYTLFADGIGAFESDAYSGIFNYGENSYTFRDHSSHLAAFYADDFSSVVFTDSRVIIDGTEYFYTVAGKTVTLYTIKGAHETSTIQLPEGETYTPYTSGTTYTRYHGGEIVFENNTYSEKIELRFTPEGYAFTVNANFAKYEVGYQIIVSYEGGKVNTVLTYLASSMDARRETYALTLRFTGNGTNTFTVVPQGDGEFKRIIQTTSEGTTQDTIVEGDTISITGGRVGAYIVSFKEGNGLVINLGTIKDSKDAALSYTGSFSDFREEADYDYHYGNVRAVDITGSDNIVYTLRVFLNEADKRFIVRSVVIEHKIDVADVGKVTFKQLWVAGTQYIGHEQKEIVQVTMDETLTETNIFTGSLTKEKAAIVRQATNTITGSYTYEAYVFNITYNEEGFVQSATQDTGYKYYEVTLGIRYRIRFLYTGEGASSEVKFLLTFSENDRYVSAQFNKETDGSWTITTANGKKYKATIAWGTSFTLKVEEIKN